MLSIGLELLAALSIAGARVGLSVDSEKWKPPAAPPSPVSSENCDELLSRYTAPAQRQSPPRDMPAELRDSYTMGGKIEVGAFFVDDTIGGKGSHYKYPRRDIDYMIQSAQRTLATGGRGGRKNERWVVEALSSQANTIEGARALVFGSMEPWYEAMLLAAGAQSVTTVEYNRLTYDHPNISVALPSDLLKKQPDGGFDVALSISSFDHDGLGRYGDPLGPDNDLRAMRTARCLLKPNGLLFLTLPIGPDAVVWNLHRRYGALRLPWMLEAWDLVSTAGWDSLLLDEAADWRRTYEPVFVLRPKRHLQASEEEL